jgi:hypothetical protein
MLVKSIETAPALAESEVVSNLSCPSESAATLRLAPEPPGLAGVEVAAELDVVEVAAGLAEELELVEELPQPARTSRPVASAGARIFEMERVVARPAGRELTGGILHGVGVIGR